MTKRELLIALLFLTALGGLVTGGVLLFRAKPAPQKLAPPAVSDEEDDDAALSEAPASTSPLPPVVPDLPDTSAVRDGGAVIKDAGPDAPPIVLRATNLLVHPLGRERECVDAQSRGAHGLQLFHCHGRGNQRWNFAEDLTGASRIFGSEGGCVRIGDAQGGEPTLVLGPCGTDSPRFLHLADKRLQEVRSGQCVTVRGAEKHPRLVLEACDPANGGQGWTFSP